MMTRSSSWSIWLYDDDDDGKTGGMMIIDVDIFLNPYKKTQWLYD